MSTLIEALAVAGSTLVNGAQNDGGKVWFFVGGSANTPAQVYGAHDSTAPLTQPVILDGGGKAEVWTDGMVRIYIEDNQGAPVSTFDYGNRKEASEVAVDNVGFTGTDLDQVITSAAASTGGQDFKYQVATGATPRSLQSKISECEVSVQDFGAKGLDSADETTAIQKAIDFVAGRGGGTVRFPPGIYRIYRPLNASSGSVTLRGQVFSSTLRNYGTGYGGTSAIIVTGAGAFSAEDLAISAPGNIAAPAIQWNSVTDASANNVNISGHLVGIAVTGASYRTSIRSPDITGYPATGAAGISYNTAGTGGAPSGPHAVIGGNISFPGGSPYTGVSFDGDASNTTVIGVAFSPMPYRIRYLASGTGDSHSVSGCAGFGGTNPTYPNPPISLESAAVDVSFQTCGHSNVVSNVANNATHAVDNSYPVSTLVALGAAAAVGPPRISASLGSVYQSPATFDLVLHNAAGGTHWTFDASFDMSSATLPGNVAGGRWIGRFVQDMTNTKWVCVAVAPNGVSSSQTVANAGTAVPDNSVAVSMITALGATANVAPPSFNPGPSFTLLLQNYTGGTTWSLDGIYQMGQFPPPSSYTLYEWSGVFVADPVSGAWICVAANSGRPAAAITVANGATIAPDNGVDSVSIEALGATATIASPLRTRSFSLVLINAPGGTVWTLPASLVLGYARPPSAQSGAIWSASFAFDATFNMWNCTGSSNTEDSGATTVANGATVAPDNAFPSFTITALGAAATIGPPLLTGYNRPAFDLILHSSAGGTTWTFATNYVQLNATTAPGAFLGGGAVWVGHFVYNPATYNQWFITAGAGHV